MGDNQLIEYLKQFWKFLGKDSWISLIVCLIIAFIVIKFVFFPFLSFITGAKAPLLIVESCSMYHSRNMESIITDPIYSTYNLSLENTTNWSFKHGINKGDIVFVIGAKKINLGDVIIFFPNQESISRIPIIHRAVLLNPISTKGDNNKEQLTTKNNPKKIDETNIKQEQIVGKAVLRIPYLGWVKLIFFEPFKSKEYRGFC